jgi:hypothetical protein
MAKRSIKPTSGDPECEYRHLEPIVEALIDAGNKPLHDRVFYMDKDGWRCDLESPIDFKLVRAQFSLSSSIILSESDGSILCKNTWIEIKGGRE